MASLLRTHQWQSFTWPGPWPLSVLIHCLLPGTHPLAALTHVLVPELPGGAMAPAFLQEGFCPTTSCSGAAPLTAPSVVHPSSLSVPHHTFFVLSTDHPPLHHISMYLLVYSLSPGMPPSSVRMGTLSGSLCVSGAGRNFWKTVDAPTFVKWVLYLKELTLSFVETIKINLCIFLA